MSDATERMISQLADLNLSELAELKMALVEEYQRKLDDLGPSGGLSPEEQAMVNGGNLLSVVKSIRDRTGLGLRESKAYMDRARGVRR